MKCIEFCTNCGGTDCDNSNVIETMDEDNVDDE